MALAGIGMLAVGCSSIPQKLSQQYQNQESMAPRIERNMPQTRDLAAILVGLAKFHPDAKVDDRGCSKTYTLEARDHKMAVVVKYEVSGPKVDASCPKPLLSSGEQLKLTIRGARGYEITVLDFGADGYNGRDLVNMMTPTENGSLFMSSYANDLSSPQREEMGNIVTSAYEEAIKKIQTTTRQKHEI